VQRWTTLVVAPFSCYAIAVAALDQLAGGEWFEIRERLHRPEQLFEHLCTADRSPKSVQRLAEVLVALASSLDGAIENGVYEVRRREINGVMGELAEAEFSSEVFGRLEELEHRMTGLVLVTACQRALLTGDIAFLSEDLEDEAESEDQSTPSPEEKDVNQIIADVKEIIQADPNAKMNAAIKNILLQLQKYREESATYKKLKDQATSYRLEMYSRTFSATFNQIFESIKKNYAAFLDEQEAARRAGQPSVIDGLETKGWARDLTSQLEQLSWARSTLLYALKEHTGVREPLVRLSRRKDELLTRIGEEADLAADVTGSEVAAHRLSRLIARDTARRLRRWSAQIASS
jgi:hypothetical protein